MNIRFVVSDTPRVYVERIDINGNTVTRDKVIRREFRINEGDAFNAMRIKRSQDRLQSLGFFQEELEIKQTQGSAPDRVVLAVDVEEKSTGEIQLSAGYSSLERFIISANIAQRNFMGKGQEVNAGVNWSRYSRSVNSASPNPICSTRTCSSAPTCSAGTTTASIRSMASGRRPIRKSAPVGACALASQSPNFSAPACAIRWSTMS